MTAAKARQIATRSDLRGRGGWLHGVVGDRVIYARPTNPWLLFWGRLTVWTALSVLSALTPVYNPGAPVWIWPLVLIACLLMAGQTAGAMKRKARGAAT